MIILLPISDIKRCPAIMLAVSRNVRANGRIRFLKISTITMNLIRAIGVPVGIKWHRKLLIDLNIANIIQANHRE